MIQNEANEILGALKTLDATERAIQEEIGEFVGSLDKNQKTLLANLVRLHHSLRAPEDELDQDNYSRRFPPQRRINRAAAEVQ
jgi:hypothetical protein